MFCDKSAIGIPGDKSANIHSTITTGEECVFKSNCWFTQIIRVSMLLKPRVTSENALSFLVKS